ncbi:MAG: rhomboid family intramembrane serine protease [Candidatus Hodarchaeales archaeon]|jgi:rhomboid protease GluP
MPTAPRGKKAHKRYLDSNVESTSLHPETNEEILQLILENGLGTFLIALVLSIIFLITLILSGDIFVVNINVVINFIQNNQAILNGEIWRLVTSIFLHGSIFHLGGNLLFLLIFGWKFEELVGTKLLVLTFVITGIGGNLLTFSLVLISNDPLLSLGASGAVQGLLGASIMLMYFEKKYTTGGLAFLGILVIFFVLTIGAQTNFLSHLGGLITGMVFSYFVYKYREMKRN